jgi:hypothetical protein
VREIGYLRSIGVITRFSSSPLLQPDIRISMHKEILGALEKLRKSTTSFAISVFPFVGMEQLDPHWTDFHEISYLSISRKSFKKILV